MRKAFISTLTELAKQDQRIILLTADLGYQVMEPFAKEHPSRFINIGVAEQNMIGIATGLAEAGFIPFVYSIVNFAVMRPYEFFRNGPILHELPVRLVGVGGGFEYGHNGISHHGLEDIGLMRVQPDLRSIIPADSEQAKQALIKTWDLPGPTYYRLGKGSHGSIPDLKSDFELDTVPVLGTGKDVLLIATGPIVLEALAAANQLTSNGIASSVAIVPVVNPSPRKALIKILNTHTSVYTLEAHYRNGGLGSMVAEIIAEENLNLKLRRFAVNSLSDGLVGSEQYLLKKHGLDCASIVKEISQEHSRQ